MTCAECKICGGAGSYLVDFGRSKIRCSCPKGSELRLSRLRFAFDFWLMWGARIYIGLMVAVAAVVAWSIFR